MATKLFKLVIDADTTTDTEVNPAIDKYFYELTENERIDEVITIPATLFTDKLGNLMTGNLTTASDGNGYYLLFINGVLQQSSLYTVDVDGAELVINDASTVPIGAPITLIVNNFAPMSDSETTVIT